VAVTDVDDQLAAIDAALKASADAIDQENQAAALAGLFGAVAGINALAAPIPTPVVMPAGPEYRGGGPPGAPSSMRGILGRDRGDVDPAKLQERLGKVLASVQKIVDKFGPDSYTISAGFPLGVNVSLTWNSTKKADSGS
jgi:hypothetical protein